MTDAELRDVLMNRQRIINSPESHFLRGTLDAAGVHDLHVKWDAILANDRLARLQRERERG